jgi:hypothetical protein
MKSNLIIYLIIYLNDAPCDGRQSPLLLIDDDFCDQLFSIVVESVYNFNVLYN